MPRKHTTATAPTGAIRVGIGGWSYAPWRETFYPKTLGKKDELAYASRQLGMIEINATFYRNQSRASFTRWHDETPAGFVFSVKAPRVATNRQVLDDGHDAIDRFVESGLDALGDKLGPLLWQLAPYKRFDAREIDGFLGNLPKKLDHEKLRHALEVRHESFRCAEYVTLARRHGVATVFSDSTEHPSFADPSGDFVYARLVGTEASRPSGYPPKALAAWAERAHAWARGEEPADLPRVGAATARQPRDVFILFISGAKERAPGAALALQEALA